MQLPSDRVPHRSGGLWLLAVLLLATSLGAGRTEALPPLPAAEQDALESLAGGLFYEGIPQERIDGLSDAGVATLGRWLADATRAAQHANILEILGRRGGRVAAAAVLRYARHAGHRGSSAPGARAGAAYRAGAALRFALGRLAQADDRALAWLVADLRPGAAAGLEEARERRILESCTWTGLALSGRPEAEALLRGVRVTPAPDGFESARRRQTRLEEALRLHARTRSLRRRPEAPGVGSAP